MAGNLKKYTKCSFLFNGILLMEADSITLGHKSNAQPVNTIEGGFSGMAPGAATCEIKCDSAVPRAGIEVDYLKSLGALDVIDIVAVRGGKKCTTQAFLTDVDETYGVNAAPKISFSMLGKPMKESTV